MARRVTRRRCQRDGIVEHVIVVYEKRLARFHDRQAVVANNRAGWLGATLVLGLPHRIFALVKDVFRIREGRHPAAIAQHGIPSGMIDVKMGAEYVVDLLIGDTQREQLVAPALLSWKVERR